MAGKNTLEQLFFASGAKLAFRMPICCAFLCLLCFFSIKCRAADVSAVRTPQDTVQEMIRLAKSGKLSYEELRTLNEAIVRMREGMRQKSRSETEQSCIDDLKEVLLERVKEHPDERLAAMEAARFLIFIGESEAALQYLSRARPASADDIEWPLLAVRAYLQLGDFVKAGIFSQKVDSLLRKKSPLALGNPVAVEQVTGYRLYTPAISDRFSPGQTLTLYLEINGADFRQSSVGSRCNLDFALELRDSMQNVIEKNDEYGRYDPEYNGPVRDLHATLYFRIPDNLDTGEYVLIIRCRDLYNNGVSAQADFSFKVGVARKIVDTSNREAQKAKAKAALMMQKVQSGNLDSLMDDMGDLDNIDDDLLNDFNELKKMTPEERKHKAAEMQLRSSQKQGNLLTK